MNGKTPEFTNNAIDLAQPRLGAEVIYATDDFFAPKERLIKPEAPIFIAGKYDDNGKWMDGWESRRKRERGFDYCIVKLCTGTIHGVDIDTIHFTGNYAPTASIEACHVETTPDENSQWHEILPSVTLQGNNHNYFSIENGQTWTHVRLNIFPDGGVARLRVYGDVYRDWEQHDPDEIVDLAAMINGGRAIICSDMHFGHMNNLIAPGRGVNMGDGWETRRRREPGYDWAIIKLARPGTIEEIEVDTSYFKGNYPYACSLSGAFIDGGTEQTLASQSLYWEEILPETKLKADKQQRFNVADAKKRPVSHVRFDIIPDGGVSRLRLYGRIQLDT